MSKQPVERILRLTGADDGARLALLGPDGATLAETALNLDLDSLQKLIDPRAYGQELARTLLTDDVRSALRAEAQTRIRLVIDPSLDVAHHRVRWECLLAEARRAAVPLSVGPGTPFSRLLHPDADAHARSPQVDWPLRILVAISNPRNLDAFGLATVEADREWAELQRALTPLRGLVEITRLDAPVTVDRIAQALEKPPAIFHFIGHGVFKRSTGEAALFLEDAATRDANVVLAKRLLQRLRAVGALPHLMVLTACESGGQVRAGALVGLAPALIEAGAGAVVAMHEKVGIDAAREFNYHLYRRLATHGVIDLAVNEARSYLLDRGGWSWSIPTLFLERQAERIFAAPPDALEAEPAAPGEILILIPEFVGHEPAFFEIDLRDRLREQLDEAALQHVRVVWLKQTAFGPGDEDAVRRLAARYGAALVIWGWYDRSRFRARFSVTASLFTYRDPGARDQLDVGQRFSQGDDFALYVNGTLPKQVDALVFFTLGQFHYWEGAYDRALAAFDRALQAAAETTLPEGLAHAYFYRGNLHAVHRQDRPAAIADYERALALQPDFANAAFNLGDARRIQANVQRRQGDEDGARQSYQAAIDVYTQAVDVAPTYARAYERRGLAHFELGEYDAAAQDYERALEHGPRAEAHYQLGLALRHLGRFDEALVQLEAAILRAPGTARYPFGAGRLQAHLGATDAAVAHFQSYLRLAPDDDRADRVRDWLAVHGADA